MVDDDASGEAADIVCVKALKDDGRPVQLNVAFYHCKFASEGQPAAVIKDLYEVCGQSQKCVSWIASPKRRTELFTHLLARNARRTSSGLASRIEVGSTESLEIMREISKQCPMTLHVVVVQPGLQKARASDAQLLLLGVVQNYLYETYQASFGVIASA